MPSSARANSMGGTVRPGTCGLIAPVEARLMPRSVEPLHLERVRKRPAAIIPYERIKLSISDWAQFMESSIDSFCRVHLPIILVMIACA